ncbi:Nucleolar protein 14 [Geodia barretti]|uniref:Nucleolar protein 14 n=1 Tax=Geodia barretti TaxID=519541 RepID=A0AA35X890_GEOBA|nr:Nucleolar protein 14 [Geodia barretti]
MGKPRSKVSAAEVVARKKKRAKRSDLSSNPFEVRVNRRKHDVLGQKIRSGRGLPGVARSRADQKRKQTLLQEYRSRGKAGVFQDKRFGEYDRQLSVEEKLAQRFFLEKKKRHGKFSLEDNDNEEGLTHFGQSLGDMEKFDGIQLSDGEEEEDISQTHFGGFLKRKRTATEVEEESETPKSRKDIMRELVVKSKQMKYERQSDKREAEELMETLDSQWEDVRGLISQPKPPPPQAVGSTDSTRASGSSDYDRVVRELAFERKAMATDRLKTTEELARDERDRLIKLEADRVQRMRGEERIQEGVMGGVDHTSADAIITKYDLH